MIYDLIQKVIVSLVAAIVSIVAAIVSQAVLKRQRETARSAQRDIERIAEVAAAESAAAKYASLEALLAKLPSGVSADQFLGKLDALAASALRGPPPETARPSAVETLITSYHEQALGQAKAQFWFSVVAATVGFGWIILAAAFGDTSQAATLLKTLPGVVMDAVAFLFFRQASETRQRATELYDRLRKDKQTTESIALVASIDDQRVRSAVKAQLALHMAGLAPAPIDLTRFVSESTETGQGDTRAA